MTLAVLAILAVLALAVGVPLAMVSCSGEKSLADDRNPFYLRGLRLREEEKFEDAAEAFEKCLRLSPTSSKAHLQLGMLYEDRLGDPVKAILHYQAFLKKSPASENADTVRKWLTRIERTYFQQLCERYPEDMQILAGRGSPDGTGGGATSRETILARRVKDLSLEVNRLRDSLARQRQQVVPPAPPSDSRSVPVGGGVPGPEPVHAAAAGHGDMAPPVTEPPAPVVALDAPPPLTEPPATDEGPLPEPVDEPADAPGPAATAAPVVAAPLSAADAAPLPPLAAGRPAVVPPPVAPATSSAPAGDAVAGMAAGTPAAAPAPAPATRPVGSGRFVPLAGAPRSGATASPAAAPRGATTAAPASSHVLYTVQKGDTLTSISRRFLGSATAWGRISALNRDVLRGGTSVKPGMKLKIPIGSAAGR